MVIAVATERGEVFQHFGHTPVFTIFEVEQGQITGQRIIPTDGEGHGALAHFLQERGVDLVICGGIGSGAQAALMEEGISLVAGVSGKVETVVTGYLNGTLEYRRNFTCEHHKGVGEHTCHRHLGANGSSDGGDKRD